MTVRLLSYHPEGGWRVEDDPRRSYETAREAITAHPAGGYVISFRGRPFVSFYTLEAIMKAPEEELRRHALELQWPPLSKEVEK